MSGRPSRKSAEIGLFRPFSAFFALFRRVRRALGKSRKRRKKAFFLRYPRISLNPHLLNPQPCGTRSDETLPPLRFQLLFRWFPPESGFLSFSGILMHPQLGRPHHSKQFQFYFLKKKKIVGVSLHPRQRGASQPHCSVSAAKCC